MWHNINQQFAETLCGLATTIIITFNHHMLLTAVANVTACVSSIVSSVSKIFAFNCLFMQR